MRKNKILFAILPAITILASGGISIAPLSSCSKNNIKVGLDNAIYHTVTFDKNGDNAIKLEGSTVFNVKHGKTLSTVVFPKATKVVTEEGKTITYQFQFWYDPTEEGNPKPVALSKVIGDDLTLYPYFIKPVDLSKCISLAVIENTDLWFDDGSENNKTVMYSTDYGRNWQALSEDPSNPLQLHPGDNAFLRCDSTDGFSTETDVNKICFSADGSVNLGGSIMGLLDYGGVKSVTDIPNDYCFNHLFDGDSAIKYVSDTFLPSLNLTPYCYESLFASCSKLKLVPTLRATTLVDHCYSNMFNGCSSLIMVNMDNYEGAITENGIFDGWLDNISTNGQLIYAGNPDNVTEIPDTWDTISPTKVIKIVCGEEEADGNFVVDHPYQFRAYVDDSHESECKNITWVSTNTDVASVNPETGVVTGIRANNKGEECKIVAYSKFDWSVKDEKPITVREIYKEDEEKMGLVTITALTKSTISWDFIGAGTMPNFRWSTNGNDWRTMWATEPIDIDEGKTIYIKGNNPNGLNGGIEVAYKYDSYTKFSATEGSKITIGGNIMGLIDDGRSVTKTIPSTYCFNNLFSGNKAITQVSSNFLAKAEILKAGCYYAMFSQCDSLSQAPSLPVYDLSGCDECYAQMFFGCDSLQTAPDLPAGKTAQHINCHLAPYCYDVMFYASGLTKTPVLPSTEPAVGCYQMMFQECEHVEQHGMGLISLTSLADYACYQLFAGVQSTDTESPRYVYNLPVYENDWRQGTLKVWTTPNVDFSVFKEPVTRMFWYYYDRWTEYGWDNKPIANRTYYF